MCIELIKTNQQGYFDSCILDSQVALQTGMFGTSVSRQGAFDEVSEFF